MSNINFEDATEMKYLNSKDKQEVISILEQEFIETRYVIYYYVNQYRSMFISTLKPTKKQLKKLNWNPYKIQPIKSVPLENGDFYDWNDFIKNQDPTKNIHWNGTDEEYHKFKQNINVPSRYVH